MVEGSKLANSSRSYRWVIAWLVAGAVVALSLLANSIRDYRFVSRLLISQQVRHQTSLRMAAFEQELRNNWKQGDERLPLLMKGLSADHPQWVEIRDSQGKIYERYGNPPERSFTKEEEGAHFRLHEPLFKAVNTPIGDAVVEAFPVYMPGLVGAPIVFNPNGQPLPPPPGPRSVMIVEAALPLVSSDQSILAPQWTNLIINCAGALALLTTVVIAGFGFRSYARGKRLEAQLAVAHEVQAALLPSLPHIAAGVLLATEYRPAEEVGGDFFDAFPVNGNGLALVLGDVSGKGVPAALIVGVIHGAVRSSAWATSAAQHERESSSLNRLLCEHASSERYASMCWCYYDPSAQRLHFVNAGHCPPLLLRKGTRVSALDELDADEPNAGGPVLGLLPDATYTQASCQLLPGDVLVMYSDGVIEAANASAEEFGEERLRALLAQVASPGVAGAACEPEAIRAAIVGAVRHFIGSTPLQDDLTLLVARFG